MRNRRKSERIDPPVDVVMVAAIHFFPEITLGEGQTQAVFLELAEKLSYPSTHQEIDRGHSGERTSPRRAYEGTGLALESVRSRANTFSLCGSRLGVSESPIKKEGEGNSNLLFSTSGLAHLVAARRWRCTESKPKFVEWAATTLTKNSPAAKWPTRVGRCIADRRCREGEGGVG